MSDFNPIIVDVLTERVRACEVAGRCVCTDTIDPLCPCHSVEAISLNATELQIAPSVIQAEFVKREV